MLAPEKGGRQRVARPRSRTRTHVSARRANPCPLAPGFQRAGRGKDEETPAPPDPSRLPTAGIFKTPGVSDPPAHEKSPAVALGAPKRGDQWNFSPVATRPRSRSSRASRSRSAGVKTRRPPQRRTSPSWPAAKSRRSLISGTPRYRLASPDVRYSCLQELVIMTKYTVRQVQPPNVWSAFSPIVPGDAHRDGRSDLASPKAFPAPRSRGRTIFR
jgi:hypothetical protein